jgi:hypothetical protein
MKKQAKYATVCFYTETGKYMGWKYLKNCSLLELRSWTKSGNKIAIH